MDLTEVVQSVHIGERADADLRSWDWLAELKAQERQITWLARKTSKSARSVYDYAYGVTVPPIEWLREAAKLLVKA